MYAKNMLKGSRSIGLKMSLLCFLINNLWSSPVFSQEKLQANLYEQTSEMGTTIVAYQRDLSAIRDFYSPFVMYPGNLYQDIAYVYATPEQRKRLMEVNTSYLNKLKSLNFETFSIYGKTDYLLLKKEIKSRLEALSKEEAGNRAVNRYLPFADEIYQLEKRRRRGEHLKAAEIAAQLSRIAIRVDSTGSILKLSEIGRAEIKTMHSILSSLKTRLKSFYEFYAGYDPEFTWWVPKPYETLDTALSRFQEKFKDKGISTAVDAGNNYGIKGLPVGKEELVHQLNAEMIPYTPEQLIQIAETEFAYCDLELLKASKEMGFGTNWRQAQEKIKNSYVPLGDQPELIVKLQKDALDFIKAQNLIDIPPLAEETWAMIMMSPERQLVNPFFTGGKEISISYPTNTMNEGDKLMSMRGNNPYFSRGTVQHELLPGHHLQYYVNSRYKSYRELFTTPFSIEGWPLYWELLLYDKGFAKTPEERMGMLFWRMHRCARILFSLNYHLGKWTPKQCVDFLVDRVGHERANAEGEVRRSFQGDYSPLYQVAYMIGGLQLMALKNELVDGGKMSYAQFHEAVLKENLIPVELIRATLTNQPLTRDFSTQWKFYNFKK